MSRNVVIGATVVVVAGVVGFLFQRAMTNRVTTIEQETEAVVAAAAEKSIEAQSEEEEALPERKIPEVLPEIVLPDATGKPRNLNEWKGRPVIVNFWATWCGPCRDEIPLLKTLRKERAADRLEVVGIAIDEQEAVLKYSKEIGMDYPILIGEQEGFEAAERFGVALVLPFSVFADSQGRIVTLKIGELHADEAGYILDRVRDVDANRLQLADARLQIADKLRDFAAERARNEHAHDD